MRHDFDNSGASPIASVYRGGKPWSFATGRGLFITPVIAGDGAIYFGSADDNFYALNPNGRLRWKWTMGNIIDAAAALSPSQRSVTIGSGDDYLYDFSTSAAKLSPAKRLIWRYHATATPSTGQLVDWWEGDIAYGPDGNIYAGNTGGTVYSFTPAGQLRWTYAAGDSVWTMPAFGAGGRTFWGSVDRYIFSLSPSGAEQWSTMTLGFVTSSPAIGSDGTVYIGSFDSRLYALNPNTGSTKWSFGTNDSIYASPALGTGANGQTDAVYIASTDGSVYKLSTSGKLLWSYDTGEPIRSSPVLGAGPDGTPDQILYVGSSDGSLYAINTANGTRRWSFDTVSTDAVLRDRHELNSSPALGRSGVYIGSEDGHLWYVPYDYCVHRANPRCTTDPGEPYPANYSRVLPVTPGGTTETSGSEGPLPASAEITGRLIVRQNGHTQYASMDPLQSASSLVHTSPAFSANLELSGDGRYVFIEPNELLDPNTTYHVSVGGEWGADGTRVADYTVPDSWTKHGQFSDTFSFTTAPITGALPLTVGPNQVTTFELRRLAVPLPAFLTSVNQIGFDSYTLLVAPLSISAPNAQGIGSILLWAVEARNGPDGTYLADPNGELMFPLEGQYEGNTLRVSVSGAVLTFSFGQVPLTEFALGFQLSPSLQSEPDASAYAQAQCADIPNYGLETYITGICNLPGGTLPAAGTFITTAYPGVPRQKQTHQHQQPQMQEQKTRTQPSSAAAPIAAANRRPAGLTVSALKLTRPTLLTAGSLTADFSLAPGDSYPAADHRVGLLLVNAQTGAPIGLNYTDESTAADAAGNVSRATLTIPSGTTLPAQVEAYVVTDVFPLDSERF